MRFLNFFPLNLILRVSFVAAGTAFFLPSALAQRLYCDQLIFTSFRTFPLPEAALETLDPLTSESIRSSKELKTFQEIDFPTFSELSEEDLVALREETVARVNAPLREGERRSYHYEPNRIYYYVRSKGGKILSRIAIRTRNPLPLASTRPRSGLSDILPFTTHADFPLEGKRDFTRDNLILRKGVNEFHLLPIRHDLQRRFQATWGFFRGMSYLRPKEGVEAIFELYPSTGQTIQIEYPYRERATGLPEFRLPQYANLLPSVLKDVIQVQSSDEWVISIYAPHHGLVYREYRSTNERFLLIGSTDASID